MIDASTLLHQSEKFTELGGLFLIKLTVSIAIFYFGKWAAEALIKLVRLGMKRGEVDETLRDFLANVLYGVLMVLVIVTALTQLGVETTSAAAVLGGAALAIGLSLQSQLSSLAAGVILILFRPFNKGDFVEIGGAKGFVEEIKIVHTRLRATDNRELTVPNSSITTQTITNYTARGLRRIDFLIGIGYGADLRKAKQVLLDTITADARVLKQPAPTVEVNALAASTVDLDVFAWVKTDDYADTRPALLEAIKLRLDAEGIAIPYPQMDVHLRKSD